MLSHRFRTALGAVRRAALALGLAAALALPDAGADGPVRAEHQFAHDPAARIQIVIKSVHVNDDHDLAGSGELQLKMWLSTKTVHHIALVTTSFDADSGTTVQLNRTLPQAGDEIADGYGSEATGISVYAGEVYGFHTWMWEVDPVLDGDRGGDTYFTFDEGSGWGNGPHTLRSTSGDYILEFEIRRTPLPNLVAHSIEIVDAPGSTDKVVCSRVVNAGLGDAGPFDVAVRIDSSTPPGGKMRVLGLGSGKTDLSCFQTDRLGPGRDHALSLNVDEAREVPEMDEASNQHLSQMYTPSAAAAAGDEPNPGPGPNPPPPPSTAQADLVVSAMRVNGKEPSGKDACEEGKHDVTVVVKNEGAANAGGFAVRLAVDGTGGEALDESVGDLETGKEQEVRFDDVRLKKGERTLTATADAKKAVAESDEGNNDRRVTATCKEDD